MANSQAARKTGFRVFAITALALIAFAGNSILCRMALKDGAIDAASFTAVRLAAGAIALLVILFSVNRNIPPGTKGSWLSAAMLFLYAICFSFAYLDLDTGIGALILFGTVQATMIGGALYAGNRPSPVEWVGWLLAVAGFVFLFSPGLSAPPWSGAILMALAGFGWGIYSLRGHKERSALAGTTFNFLRSVLFLLIVVPFGFRDLHLSDEGIILAVLSGAVTSGVGYAIWYAALGSLSSMQAAMVQLVVPVLAAAGGMILLSEVVSARLVVAGMLILGGICTAVFGKEKLRNVTGPG